MSFGPIRPQAPHIRPQQSINTHLAGRGHTAFFALHPILAADACRLFAAKCQCREILSGAYRQCAKKFPIWPEASAYLVRKALSSNPYPPGKIIERNGKIIISNCYKITRIHFGRAKPTEIFPRS